MVNRTKTAWVLLAGATAALALAGTAAAKDGDVRVQGRCTGASTAKLELSEENGRIEVEFEVDQNRGGVPWKVNLKRNGSVFFRGKIRTRPPSGSFELRRLARNGAGPETIRARAKSPSGEICTATARF